MIHRYEGVIISGPELPEGDEYPHVRVELTVNPAHGTTPAKEAKLFKMLRRELNQFYERLEHKIEGGEYEHED